MKKGFSIVALIAVTALAMASVQAFPMPLASSNASSQQVKIELKAPSILAHSFVQTANQSGAHVASVHETWGKERDFAKQITVSFVGSVDPTTISRLMTQSIPLANAVLNEQEQVVSWQFSAGNRKLVLADAQGNVLANYTIDTERSVVKMNLS